MRSARFAEVLLPLLLKAVDAAATPPRTCLRFGDASACHHTSDGSFTIMRPPGAAKPSTYNATTTLGGCYVVSGSPEAAIEQGKDPRLHRFEDESGLPLPLPLLLRASKRVRCPNDLEATVEDSLVSETDGTLRWDIAVSSPSHGYWTAPIVSTVRFPGHTNELYWFGGSTGGDVDLGPIEFGKCGAIKGDTQPKGTCDFKYGGDYADPTTPPNEVWDNQLVLPIWSYYGPQAAAGAVALVQSPLLVHAPVFARLTTYSENVVATFDYSRELSRLGNGSSPALFRQQLLHTAADWRPAAGWMVETYPEFFFPNASASIEHIEGAGAYADYRGVGVDEAYRSALERMNFGINWDAVFPYPFHGVWMPYAPLYNNTWENCFIHPSYDKQPSPFNVTHAWIAGYYRSMERDLGFHSCTYANWFEFGWNISNTKPVAPLECSTAFLPDQAACNARSQCRANQLFWEHFEPAAVRQWVGGPQWPSEIPGKDDSHGKGSVSVGDLLRPTGCLGSPCALMDPGHEVYKRHLLAMGKAMIELAPSSGLCVDRQDMVGGVINDRADDGRTYYTSNSSKISAEGSGVVARSSMFSVMELLESMGDLMHSAGKTIMVNTHTSRIDMFRHVDGVFDEHGDNPVDNMKITALNTLAMPAVIWNHGGGKSDEYLQRHLYFGVNCMVPFPDNDHSIHDTSAETTRIFVDYGPMFAQLRSKAWVLVAHAAEVTSANSSAKVNFFKTSLGNGTHSYAAPVMLAGPDATTVNVTLRCDASSSGQVSVGCGEIPKRRLVASVLHPGVEPSSLEVTWGATGELIFNKLRLRRGCAMIVLRDSADPPPPPMPPPLPPLPPPPSPPTGDCTAGCKLEMVPCNKSSSSQRFTYDGKHLHNEATKACVDMNKASLVVSLWSPCETATDDDQWWSFAFKNQSSGALSGVLQMKGVTVHSKVACLDVDTPSSSSSASLKASTHCDAKTPSQQWSLQSPGSGSLLQNGGGLCVGSVHSMSAQG